MTYTKRGAVVEDIRGIGAEWADATIEVGELRLPRIRDGGSGAGLRAGNALQPVHAPFSPRGPPGSEAIPPGF